MADATLVVALPPRLDRRLRLGPFASGREALRALLYFASAALASTLFAPLAGVPIAGFGLLALVWRPGGEALDERAGAIVLWATRRLLPGPPMNPGSIPEPLRRAWLRVGGGVAVAIVRTGGIPLAFLPPGELRRRFETFRELLVAGGGRLAFLATAAPIHATALVPGAPYPRGPERAARQGYCELVELIARRRSIRQVYLAVAGDGSDPPALLRLEGELAGTIERLTALGTRPARLRHRALRAAADRMGLLSSENGR